MNIFLIAAVSTNNVIGNKGEIPWNIPEDFQRFRERTMGYPLIMGRKTSEAIINGLGKPLEGRINIVLSASGDYCPEGVIVLPNLGLALEKAREYGKKVYVIGGESVYKKTIGLASTLEITEVHKTYEGDSFFPEIDKRIWQEMRRQNREGYSFVMYKRCS